LFPIGRLFSAKLNNARDIAPAIQHSLDANPTSIRQIVDQEIGSADNPESQRLVSRSPSGMRTRHRVLDKEFCRLLRQPKKSVSRLNALSCEDISENALKVALRPGT
jgi:hypothetical protein